MYNIEWKEHSLQNIKKIEFSVARRIIKKIDELSENPFSKIKRLKNREEFSLRIGDYRVLMEIEKNIIKILKIGHRKNIYDK